MWVSRLAEPHHVSPVIYLDNRKLGEQSPYIGHNSEITMGKLEEATLWMAIGIAAGMVLGVLLGILIGNLKLGLGAGIAVGSGTGVAVAAWQYGS